MNGPHLEEVDTSALTPDLPDRMVPRRRAGPTGSVEAALPAMLATPEEAALVLRIGRSKVYDLMRSGQLSSVKIGSSRRIPVRALALFVEALGSAA
jgi:excisionase family DNA binding protein